MYVCLVTRHHEVSRAIEELFLCPNKRLLMADIKTSISLVGHAYIASREVAKERYMHLKSRVNDILAKFVPPAGLSIYF